MYSALRAVRRHPERGATAVEYILMVVIIVAVVVLVVAILGGGLGSMAGFGGGAA